MILSSTIRRFIACIACMALVFAALAPAITHAGAGGKWAELCTMDGVKLVKVSDSDSGPDSANAMGQHCAYCLIHVNLSAPANLSAELIHPLEVTAGHPVLYFTAPQRLSAWSTPQSRAPPTIS